MENELLLPTNLLCGYFDCSSFYNLKVSPERTCTMFEIEYFVENGKTMFSNGTAYPILRNWVYICAPGEVRNSELPFKSKYVKFSASGKLAELLRSAPRYFRIYRSFEAVSLLDEILSLYAAPKQDDLLLNGKLLSYISLLLEESKQPLGADADRHAVIIKAQEFMKANYGEPIQLCDIAKEVNLSPNYFHTLFSEACGITPREYLTKHHISIAGKLLLTTQLSICEIAEKCGFKNQQYLSSVFKSSLGCSPIQYKNKHRNAYFI